MPWETIQTYLNEILGRRIIPRWGMGIAMTVTLYQLLIAERVQLVEVVSFNECWVVRIDKRADWCLIVHAPEIP